jgi:hypothetical protein
LAGRSWRAARAARGGGSRGGSGPRPRGRDSGARTLNPGGGGPPSMGVRSLSPRGPRVGGGPQRYIYIFTRRMHHLLSICIHHIYIFTPTRHPDPPVDIYISSGPGGCESGGLPGREKSGQLAGSYSPVDGRFASWRPVGQNFPSPTKCQKSVNSEAHLLWEKCRARTTSIVAP